MRGKAFALGRWRSRARVPLPFCAAERSTRPAGIVVSLFEPEGRVCDTTRRARAQRGDRRSRRYSGGVSLVTFLSLQESDSPAGAKLGQRPPVEGNKTENQPTGNQHPACVRMHSPKRRRPGRKTPLPTTKQAPAMPQPIDYYFVLNSPWSYLAARQLGGIVERTGAELRLKPVQLPTLFAATGGQLLRDRSPARQLLQSIGLARG